MESFFSLLKTERTEAKTYRTREWPLTRATPPQRRHLPLQF